MKLFEKYITYYYNKRSNRHAHINPVEMTVFLNPSVKEIQKNLISGARGYIDYKGNLYIQGVEDKSNVSGSMGIHFDLFDALMKEKTVSGKVKKSLFTVMEDEFQTKKNLKECDVLGLAVQRSESRPKEIYLSESYWDEDVVEFESTIISVLNKAQELNPSFIFKAQKIV